MGKPTTEFYRQLRSDLGQGPFAVNAARRIKASTIVKEGYTEKQGAQELARLTAYFKDYPSLCQSLGVKGDMHFYKFRGSKYGGYDIVCMVNDQAVGSVHLSVRNIELKEGSTLKGMLCMEPSSFISLPYRGKGIVFGMYQWAISQYNLIGDERQTRASFNLWKRLAKMYPFKVLTRTHQYRDEYRVDPEAKLTLKTTRLLIERHT